MHYCMGELADWSLSQNNSGICSKCGMKKTDNKDNGCCKDEHKFVKNDTDQKITETGLQLTNALSIHVSFFEISTIDLPSVSEVNPVSHAPPRSVGVAKYIRNCVFLI